MECGSNSLSDTGDACESLIINNLLAHNECENSDGDEICDAGQYCAKIDDYDIGIM